MPDSFTFELVSPEKLLISKSVAMVTVPGALGEFGVLPGHAPMISTVASGVIQVYVDAQAIADRIFVAGGFAEVSQTRCTVLAQEAIPVAELNKTELQAEAKQIEAKLAQAQEEDRATLQEQRDLIEAKLRYAA